MEDMIFDKIKDFYRSSLDASHTLSEELNALKKYFSEHKQECRKAIYTFHIDGNDYDETPLLYTRHLAITHCDESHVVEKMILALGTDAHADYITK